MNERILAGRYRLQDAALGRADLYQAEDVSLRRKVAVRRLPGNVSSANRHLWEQEIAKAAGLHDPHLLSIYDVVMEEDGIFLITEDMDGPVLSRWLRGRTPMAPEDAVDIVRQLARAAVQAEKHGLQEISIDPNSVLMTREGFVKVIHYGPLYTGSVKPEPADLVRTAGILLYEMITGETYSDLLPARQVLDDLQIALREAKSQFDWLPARLLQIEQRALGTTSEGAYSTMQDLYKDIHAVHHALTQMAAAASGAAAKQEPAPEAALPSRLERAKSVVGKAQEKAQEQMQKVAQVRRFEFVKKITEQNSQSKKRTPMTMVYAVLVVVLVAGGLWWTLGGDKSGATMAQTSQGKEVKMPNLLNKSEEQAYQVLTENGFPEDHIQVVYRPTDDSLTKGKIYRQSVDPNMQVATNDLIVLTINGNEADAPKRSTTAPANGNGTGTSIGSGGSTQAVQGTVPDLRGKSQAEAEQLLLQAGYRYSYTIEQGDTPAGTVFGQDVAAGSQAAAGTRVTFKVSQ